MEHIQIIRNITGFEWDAGNSDKSWHTHGVSKEECEQIFFNTPILISTDEKHSIHEKRYFALGRAEQNRMLVIVFTIRGELIRVISGRDMSRKEKTIYEQA